MYIIIWARGRRVELEDRRREMKKAIIEIEIENLTCLRANRRM